MKTEIIIIGTKHIYETELKDTERKGKEFIFGVLNQYNPDAIFLEQGYDYLEVKPCSPEYQMDDTYKESLYAVKWAREHGKEFSFIDLEKPISGKLGWNTINREREKAISDKIKEYLEHHPCRIALFIGANHHKSIVKALRQYHIISEQMPWIRNWEIFLVKTTEPIKYQIRKLKNHLLKSGKRKSKQ